MRPPLFDFFLPRLLTKPYQGVRLVVDPRQLVSLAGIFSLRKSRTVHQDGMMSPLKGFLHGIPRSVSESRPKHSFTLKYYFIKNYKYLFKLIYSLGLYIPQYLRDLNLYAPRVGALSL